MKKASNTPFDLVAVKPPRVPGGPKHIYLSVNDYNCVLPVGQVSEIPRFAAEVYFASVAQDERTQDMIERLGARSAF